MTEHVNVETARRLRSAGWQWEPQFGDRVQCGPSESVWLVAVNDGGYPLIRDEFQELRALPSECLHLPTAGQLLAALAKTGDPHAWHVGDTWIVIAYTRSDGPFHREKRMHRAENANLAQAAACCWLAVKEAEET